MGPNELKILKEVVAKIKNQLLLYSIAVMLFIIFLPELRFWIFGVFILTIIGYTIIKHSKRQQSAHDPDLRIAGCQKNRVQYIFTVKNFGFSVAEKIQISVEYLNTSEIKGTTTNITIEMRELPNNVQRTLHFPIIPYVLARPDDEVEALIANLTKTGALIVKIQITYESHDGRSKPHEYTVILYDGTLKLI